MRIVLHRGTSVVSKLIKLQSRGLYSHASLLFDDGTVIESREGSGVSLLAKIKKGSPHESVDIFEVETTPEQDKLIREFAIKQVGKSYDWTMIVRFITRKQATRSSAGKWFCSELVFAAFMAAGINLLARTEPWEVSPSLLSKSPFLKYIQKA